jgi:hypothetical protein
MFLSRLTLAGAELVGRIVGGSLLGANLNATSGSWLGTASASTELGRRFQSVAAALFDTMPQVRTSRWSARVEDSKGWKIHYHK